MAELALISLQVITDELRGVHRMVGMMNENVRALYRGTSDQMVNIVSADFFQGTELVEAANDWNHIHSQHLACNVPQQ
jgi:hypothetical protein